MIPPGGARRRLSDSSFSAPLSGGTVLGGERFYPGMAFLKTLFDGNERELVKLRRTAERVNALEPQISALTDDQLRAKTDEFKARLEKGETLDQLMPEAFAVVREVGKRVLGMRHFDVQIMGGQALHEGNVAEMRTGEGKTLVATLPVYLNALTGKGVHVVTVGALLGAAAPEQINLPKRTTLSP